MTPEDDPRKLPRPVPPEQMTPELVDDMFLLDSALQDYLFAPPRQWPHYDEVLAYGLRHDERVQMHALKLIQLMRRSFPEGIRLRADLPADIRALLLERCDAAGIQPPDPAP